jgi:hypothetical protein
MGRGFEVGQFDIDIYDLLLGLDFIIKINAMVDVEKVLIQIRHGLGNNVQALPLNMVNMLHLILEAITRLKNTTKEEP